jgi:glycosyltransferase involved in cell wall biosynthesis
MSKYSIKISKIFSHLLRYGLLKTVFYSLYRLAPSSFALLFREEAIQVLEEVAEIIDTQTQQNINHKKRKNIEKITWFVPHWTNVWGGGHFTIFRFAHFFEKQGVKNEIYIYDNRPEMNAQTLEKEIANALPGSNIKVILDIKEVGDTTIAIATTWQSAYHVKNFYHADFYFYFMQDYEPLFYPSGSQSLQADYTYRFGFIGITGGLWLRNIFEQNGGIAEHYTFAIDHDIFYPKTSVRDQVKRVFFYGRPSTPRRAFALGMSILAAIKAKYPEIEIVIAGLNNVAPPPFGATMLGNLSLKETGELYRSCDIGIALSATNLSYLPLELMGSGCPVLSNSGPFVEWFCKNEENCLIAEPTASNFLEQFTRLYESKPLREKLVAGGIRSVQDRTWDSEMKKIFNYIQKMTLEKPKIS